MCGINGYISTKVDKVQDVLIQMNQEIIHRGPDDDGFFYNYDKDSHIGMAMRRLSIIDLSSGKQPIYSQNKDKVIVFNGEIYNYLKLRTLLIEKGYHFETNSDTEVVVNLYDCFGTDSFSMLDGMFALSIFDKNSNKLILVRDFFGEKPLYYLDKDSEFIWASELKSIIKILPNKPNIDKKALNLYLQLTYIPAPYTIYENIKKLEPNKYLTLDCLTLTYTINEIEHSYKKYDTKYKPDVIKKTHDLVYESVCSRSISEVPIGTFLSGGVDSSIVSLCLSKHSEKKIDTFSIGFEKKSYDESDKARQVAKIVNSNHHEFIIGERDLNQNLSEIILNFDEPFADSSALAAYVVSKKAKEFVTVVLTGDGGDEVFGGYNKYYMGDLNERYTNLFPQRLHKKIMQAAEFSLKTSDDNRGLRFKANRLLKAINYDGDFYYNIISLGFTSNELAGLLKSEFIKEDSMSFYKELIGSQNKSLTDFRNIDKHLSLEGDLLVKMDRTSMLNSLECRSPFLNKEIWNFSNQLEHNYLIKGWDKKHILKEAFKIYFPSGFLNVSKKGFGVPVGDWLKSNLKLELLSYIDNSLLKEQSIFNIENIQKLVHNHINGNQDNTFRVWTFFCFQKWYYQIYEK